MEVLRRMILGQAAKGSYPKVPTDEVIPLFTFDDTPIYRNAVGCWSLRFNDVLNGDKLHAALARLFEIDGWRKLGGRFRLNEHDKLEIHIPQAFTKERPAVNYSQASYDIKIDEHPFASSYPDLSQNAAESLETTRGHIRELGLPDSVPKCLADYLSSDSPLLSLHIVNFTDATLVNLCWPHCASDAFGLRDILRSLALVLEGREAEVVPMLSFREDPLSAAGRNPKFQERHAQEDDVIRMPWLLLWGIRYVLDIWLYPKMEPRGLFLSREVVQKLKEQAINSLPVQNEGRKPFISNGDVISAWIGQIAASVLSPTSRRTVIISNALDLRDRAPSVFKATEGQGSYVQNAVLPLCTPVPAYELASRDTGLGTAALAVRQTIEVQKQEGQVHALARLNRRTLEEGGLPPLFGNSSAFFVILSNWTKARVFDKVDFGAAVVGKGSRKQAIESKPVYFHVEGLSPNSIFARNTFLFVETPSGGYSIRGHMPPEIWQKAWDAISRL